MSRPVFIICALVNLVLIALFMGYGRYVNAKYRNMVMSEYNIASDIDNGVHSMLGKWQIKILLYSHPVKHKNDLASVVGEMIFDTVVEVEKQQCQMKYYYVSGDYFLQKINSPINYGLGSIPKLNTIPCNMNANQLLREASAIFGNALCEVVSFDKDSIRFNCEGDIFRNFAAGYYIFSAKRI